MDPVSHVIFGRTLIALDRRGRFGAGAVAAAALGAIAPDIDVLAICRGWDVYLRVHEIGTHSIVGSVVMGSAAGDARLFAEARRQIRRIGTGRIDRRAQPRRLRSRVGRAASSSVGPSAQGARACRSSRWPIRGSSRSARPAQRAFWVLRRRAFTVAASCRCGNRDVPHAQRRAHGRWPCRSGVRQRAPTRSSIMRSKRRGAPLRSGTSPIARRMRFASGASMPGYARVVVLDTVAHRLASC